jgi:hypothetical protein
MRSIVKIHRRSMVRRSMALSLLVFAGVSTASLAQDAARPAPKRGITVPCCKCIDGKSQTINLNTGTAPWTSNTGSVALVPSPNAAWASKPPAKWIYTGSNAPGLYTYNLNIHVPKDCIIPMDVSFKGTATTTSWSGWMTGSWAQRQSPQADRPTTASVIPMASMSAVP